MSRGAYEAHFGQAAPPGAVFGVDVTWWQSGGDYGTTAGYWSDFGTWADFVCVRTSYGSSGDDGAQDLHFQIAAERGYSGLMGTYHYIYPSGSAASNTANYLARSDPFIGRTTFDMLDFEENPPVSASFIDEMCDRVEQARQRPCLIYGGYSYLNQSGAISCPAWKLWTPHYAASGSNAWVPTTDPQSWDAPLVPAQFAGQYPGIWQWSSLTPQHGHLDLNISTTPEALGGSLGSAGTIEPIDDFWSALMADPRVDDLFNRLDRIEASTQATNWQVGNVPALAGNEPLTIASQVKQLVDLANAILSSASRGEVSAANANWQVGNVPALAGNEQLTIASQVKHLVDFVNRITGMITPSPMPSAAAQDTDVAA